MQYDYLEEKTLKNISTVLLPFPSVQNDLISNSYDYLGLNTVKKSALCAIMQTFKSCWYICISKINTHIARLLIIKGRLIIYGMGGGGSQRNSI